MNPVISAPHKAEFTYGRNGRGFFTVYDMEQIKFSVECRTGSIGADGQLKNAITPRDYYFCKAPELAVGDDLVDNKMYCGTAFDWKPKKIRLYTESNGAFTPTHLLYHSDGGKGGTAGCIGSKVDTPWIYDYYEMLFTQYINRAITVTVNGYT